MTQFSRRRFLKQAFGFSAAAMLAGCQADGPSRAAPADTTPIAPDGCHLLAIGDFGVRAKDLPRQKAVSDAMAGYLDKHQLKPRGLALLGDNFYGGLSGMGVKSPRWKDNIEQMYPAGTFDCPLYALLGNHDYGDEKLAASAIAQLAYRNANPASRWTLPARWYSFELATAEPLATVLVIDSNFSSSTAFTAADRKAQLDWLNTQLKKPRKTPWLFVWGHHPVFSNGSHGDSVSLVKDIDPLLRRYQVDLYLSGHDHDLQHIEMEGHPTSFVVSGAGGARARAIKKFRYNAFGQAVYGFTHLQLHADRFVIRQVDANGKTLHAFTKNGNGVKMHAA